MSKYYFRVHSTSKNKHFETDSGPTSAHSEKFLSAEKKDIPTKNNNLEYSSNDSVGTSLESTRQTKTHIAINSTKQLPQKTNESEKVTPHTYSKKQHHISHSQEAKSSFPTEAEIALAFLIIAMMIIVFTGICVFLISWIFAPALLALKIALWTMAGLAVLPVILFIIVLFSQL
jgi:NADH:ubiquinone oxidoreductase subunit 3 (subunit A)